MMIRQGMRTIHLHGAAGERFGGPFVLAVESPAEAIRGLTHQIPGLKQYPTAHTITIDTGALPAATTSAAGAAALTDISTLRTGSDTAKAATADAIASLWQKGSDIASASTLSKPSDANLGGYHVITGTTAVTTMWTGTTAGEEYEFEAAGAHCR